MYQFYSRGQGCFLVFVIIVVIAAEMMFEIVEKIKIARYKILAEEVWSITSQPKEFNKARVWPAVWGLAVSCSSKISSISMTRLFIWIVLRSFRRVWSYATAFMVIPCCMKSTNKTPCLSQNTDAMILRWDRIYLALTIIGECVRGMHGPGPGPKPIPGPANKRWFFQRAGPTLQMRGDFSNGPGRTGKWEMIFSNGAGWAGKTEMSFSTAGQGWKKERRIIFRANPGRQNKDEVFKSADKRSIMNLI